MWVCFPVRVCLPVCGHGRGNRAPCAGRSICASFAPLGVYIYAVGGESSTTRHPLLRSARQGPDRDRAWHPRVLGQGDAYSSLASGKSLTPPARCIHRPQRDTSSLEYQLLVSRASAGASREPSSRRSPALTPRTRRLDPTFRYGAFFFVASALADVPSTRLTVGDRPHGTVVKGLFARCRRLAHWIYDFVFSPLTYYAARNILYA